MTGYPQRYIILDTETNAESIPGKLPTKSLSFRLASTLTVDPDTFEDTDPHWFDVVERDDFKTLLIGPRKTSRTIYIFAHNMGFDSRIIGLWSMLADGTLSLMPDPEWPGAKRYKEPLLIVDDYMFIVRTWRRDGQQVMWMDTVQWFKMSLEKLGQSIKISKLMMPDADAPDSAWMTYCRGDVDVLHQALLRLWAMLQRHGIEDWEYTPASLSRRFYRMRFERKRIKIPDDPQIMGLDRLGYYGGLLECYRVGPMRGPIYQVDVNSLYPHVMSQKLFPCEVIDHGDHSELTGVPDGFRPEETTAEVWLNTDDRPYPVRGADQTWYCRGKVRTVLCGPELDAAVNSNHVVRVGRWVRYKTCDLFSSWATYWRRSRGFAQDRGDKFGDKVIKDIMNSLHGKFGQQTGAWKWVGKTHKPGTYMTGNMYNADFRKFMQCRVINGEMYERGETGEDDDSFVPIAAWTAAYGREYMRWMMEICGPGNVLYICTDSLLVTSDGYKALLGCGMIDPAKMGHFKVEICADEVNVWSVNQIDLDTLKRRSGVKAGSVEIEHGIWSTELWESCANGIATSSPDSVSVVSTFVRPSLSYSGRQVLTGGITEPWWIDCWSESPEAIAKTKVRTRLSDRIQ